MRFAGAEILAALCCRAAIARLESPLFYRLTRGCRRLAYACGGGLLMQSLEPYWGRQALDFVDAIEASKTSARVIAQFQRIIGNPRFSAYIMAGISTLAPSPRPLT